MGQKITSYELDRTGHQLIWNERLRQKSKLGYGDIAGYGILGVSMHQDRTAKRMNGPCNPSSSAKDAVLPSKASERRSAADGVRSDAVTSPTANVRRKSGKPALQPPRRPSASTSAPRAARARTATASASAPAAGPGSRPGRDRRAL